MPTKHEKSAGSTVDSVVPDQPEPHAPSNPKQGTNRRRADLERYLTKLGEDPAPVSDGELRTLSALLSDAIEDADHETLSEATHGLKWLSDRLTRAAGNGMDETRAQVNGLLTLASVASERVTSRPDVRVPTNEHAYRFLAAICDPKLRTSSALQSYLRVHESEISRQGRRLLEQGLARRFKVGRSVVWEPTAKGRRLVDTSRESESPIENRGSKISISFDPLTLASLLREAETLQGYEEAASHFRRRLVSPESLVLGAFLGDAGHLFTPELLSTRTNLSPPAVLRVIDSLLGRRCIESVGSITGSPWKARLRLRQAEHCAVGVTAVGDRLVGVVTDLRAGTLRRDLVPLKSTSPAEVCSAIATFVKRLIGAVSEDNPQRNILGLGIELAGHVDSRTGRVLLSPNLGWDNPVEVGATLQRDTGLPTIVDNDANALTIYEQLYGDAVFADTFVAILVSDGIGSGIVVDHQLIRGAHGVAGELGHLPLGNPADACRCGKRGCLEASASAPAIVRAVRRLLPNEEVLDLNAACRVARDNDAALTVFSEAGRALGSGVEALLNLVGPKLVLVEVPRALDRLLPLDGGIPNIAAEAFYESLLDEARKRSFSNAFERCRIEVKHVPEGLLHGATGAAVAVISRFVEDPLNDLWFNRTTEEPREEFLRTGRRFVEIIGSLAGQEIEFAPSEGGTDIFPALRESVRELLGVPPVPKPLQGHLASSR